MVTRSRPSALSVVLLVLITAVTDRVVAQPLEAVREGDALVNSIGMILRRIPAGTFIMGEASGSTDEIPHRVRLTESFYIGRTEVTQGQYERIVGENPSWFRSGGLGEVTVWGRDTSDFPVDNVTWYEARDFCAKLSDLPGEREAGRVYRLPTEAEWEYACRAGSTAAFTFGNVLTAAEANFHGGYPVGFRRPGRYLKRTQPVGVYPKNDFDLFDVHGNVREWCQDWFDADYYRTSPVDDPQGPESGQFKVQRGGSWENAGVNLRSARRQYHAPGYRFGNTGFRVVCEVDSPEAAPAADAETAD